MSFQQHVVQARLRAVKHAVLFTLIPFASAGCHDDWICRIHPSLPECQLQPDAGEDGGTVDATVPDAAVDAGDEPDAGPPVVTVTSVAVGNQHTCALFSTGGVRCWGSSGSGVLGNPSLMSTIGDDEPPSVLSDISLGAAAVQIDASGSHTCAVLAGGTVRCWGAGSDGKLGYGSTANVGDNEPPSDLPALDFGEPAVQVAVGYSHTCVLLSSGGVRCWGSGTQGKLGRESNTSLSAPPATNIELGGNVAQLAAGDSHTCARLVTGALKCWGGAALGQLGYGSTTPVGDTAGSMPPPDVTIGDSVAFVSAGSSHTCAIKSAGGVLCWGQAGDGVLGQPGIMGMYSFYFGDQPGETPSILSDIDLGPGPSPIGVTSGLLHNCVNFADGRVLCWGVGTEGELGDGQNHVVGDGEAPGTQPPTPLGGLATGVVAGNLQSCVLMASGGLRCFGLNNSGQIGYGLGVAPPLSELGDDATETPALLGDVPLF